MLALAFTLLALAATPAAPVVQPGNLGNVTTPRPGNWQRTAIDRGKLAPGASMDLLNTASAGQVVRFWFTMQEGTQGQSDQYNLRTMRIEMWWDGAKEPAVRVPACDFFGVGHGIAINYNSGVASSSWRALTSYWPMPFQKGARIVATNDGDTPIMLFSQVDWMELPADQVPPTRLQASWRRNVRTDQGNLLVAEATGRGQLVGTVLAITPLTRSWWGEGDDVYEIDGRTILGTGTEDFVNQGWGVQVLATTWAGTLRQGARHLSLYRWMVADPIPFQRTFRLSFGNQGYFRAKRNDDISATALWYQEAPLSPVPALPTAADRLPLPATMNQVWALPGAVKPLDVHAAGKAAGRALTDATPLLRWPPEMLKVGTQKVAGVELPIRACNAGKACGVALRPDESFSIDLPAPAPALWLLVAAEGIPPDVAVNVTAGEKVIPLHFGRELDNWLDPWPVANGRMVQAGDTGINMQAAYAVPVPLPEGVTKVTIATPSTGKGAVIWAAGFGPLPKEPLSTEPVQGLPKGED